LLSFVVGQPPRRAGGTVALPRIAARIGNGLASRPALEAAFPQVATKAIALARIEAAAGFLAPRLRECRLGRERRGRAGGKHGCRQPPQEATAGGRFWFIRA